MPVYPDSVGVVTKDGQWTGTRNCLVRKGALAQVFPPSFYTTKVSDIQWLLDVVMVGGDDPWLWESNGTVLPFWFSSGPSTVYRPVQAYKHGKHVVFVDAAFGPPPAALYGRAGIHGYPVPLVDAKYETQVNLILAPMTLDEQETLKLTAQLISAGLDGDAVALACMDVLSDASVPVSKDDILQILESVTVKLLQEPRRIFLKAKAFDRSALDEAIRMVKSHLTSLPS